MIIDFKIKNFKSFKEEEFFSMDVKGKYPNEPQIHKFNGFEVLPSAVIYGANASGKSNFIEGLKAFQSFIILSRSNITNLPIFQYKPFLFDEINANLPNEFELVFLIEHIKYRYILSFSEFEVLHEALYFYPNHKAVLLFDRNKQSYKWGEQLKGEKKVVSHLTSKNQSYLSKGAENNIEQLGNVFNYFQNELLLTDDNIDFEKGLSDFIAELLLKDSNFHKNFELLLASLDTGIVDIEVEKLNNNRGTFLSISQYRFFTSHKMTDGSLKKIPLHEESLGTQKLFILGGIMLNQIHNGSVLVIDEFERSLHPQMSKFLLGLFNNPEINTNGAQLIVATHDTELITKDNNLLKDQIWFVEKDDEGVSQLFSLADIKGVDKDAPFDKWYLTGRLGGVPTIKKFTFEQNYQPTLKNEKEKATISK